MLPYAAMAASELGSLFGRLPEWLAEGTGSYPTIVFDTVKNTEDYVPVHCKKFHWVDHKKANPLQPPGLFFDFLELY